MIVSWDWNIPSGANTHSCLLAVVSSNDDPLITPETNVNNLVTSEKRVCLKNLHVIDSGGPSPSQTLVEIKFHNVKDVNDIIDIVIDPTFFAGTIGMLFEPIEFINKNEYLYGVYKYSLRDGEDIGEWYTRPGTKEKVDHSKLWDKLDRSHLYEFDGTKTSEIKGIKIGPKQTLQAIISCKGSRKVPYDHNQKFTVMQRQGGEIVGGSTFEIRLKRVAALYPISHIRITVEKILLIDKKSYDVKDGKNLRLIAITSFNDDSCSCNIVQIPKNGYLKPEEWHNSYNIQLINNVCIYDGYVAEKDSVSISFITSYEGCNDADTEQTLYKLYINGPPEVWVGKYSPDNIPVNSYIENPSGLMIWYRIESIRL